ncbi:sigma-54 dependent transcriptional regulator [Campylobacter sp. 19-13652]|uniref:sigma-54-dependent transcriptional regulator n=1 Tax=Campylobacter sp. 19-13652 TaxID=2840180 RepID=UPI001C77B143|nr:sigma-54 dependent transcriptional regulator [Campylobacter sp. 19-13652]BCX79049.1 ATPase AAA [Campylobacter sp. 19-13652]
MNIAIVEDDINMRKSLEIALSEYDELNLKTYKSAVEALKKLDESVDLIITDINMPRMDGLEFIKELNGRYDVIIMTGNATLNRAIESVRLGVRDFLTKPFDADTLYAAIMRIAKLKEVERELADNSKKSNPTNNPAPKTTNGGFIASSEALEATKNIALKAAKTDVSILLNGESGVGKEVFAHFIHDNSPRKDAAFIALNMAALPENLIESELFGYEKGAFTDASVAKPGQFELANNGTLFLDEIAEMPMPLQAKLLRAIQEGEACRLGGVKPVKFNVRIIAATNANLKEAIANGKFREDLYYRLATIPLAIPPLRERKDEILGIADSVLKSACDEYSLGVKTIQKEACDALLEYEYPGNIRELISIIKRAAILSEGEFIGVNDLFLDARRAK